MAFVWVPFISLFDDYAPLISTLYEINIFYAAGHKMALSPRGRPTYILAKKLCLLPTENSLYNKITNNFELELKKWGKKFLQSFLFSFVFSVSRTPSTPFPSLSWEILKNSKQTKKVICAVPQKVYPQWERISLSLWAIFALEAIARVK